MANEFSIVFTIRCTNGPFSDQYRLTNQFNQNAMGYAEKIVAVGTSAADVGVSVATSGFVFLQNLDATNYLQYGRDASGTLEVVGKLKPGEFAFFRLDPGCTLMAQANTAAVNLLVKLYED